MPFAPKNPEAPAAPKVERPMGMRKAIFKKCLDCCGYERARVDECRTNLCPLHKWRNRAARKETRVARLEARKKKVAEGGLDWLPGMRQDIFAKCLDCCIGQYSEVKHCPVEGCTLWEFRNRAARKLRQARLDGATPEQLAEMKDAEDANDEADSQTDSEGDDEEGED